jgi:hypothetical protein
VLSHAFPLAPESRTQTKFALEIAPALFLRRFDSRNVEFENGFLDEMLGRLKWPMDLFPGSWMESKGTRDPPGAFRPQDRSRKRGAPPGRSASNPDDNISQGKSMPRAGNVPYAQVAAKALFLKRFKLPPPSAARIGEHRCPARMLIGRQPWPPRVQRLPPNQPIKFGGPARI